MTGALGRTTWVVACGHIPFESHGPEPALTSRDQITILNAGGRDAEIAITIHHPDMDPVGPYRFTVAARRIRQVRFNDLIFPQALALDRPFGAVIRADVPVVVQFTRLDSGGRARSRLGGNAHGSG